MSEKNLNFDQPVERRGTHSLKYDFAEERGRKKEREHALQRKKLSQKKKPENKIVGEHKSIIVDFK